MEVKFNEREYWTVLLGSIFLYDKFGDHDLDTASLTSKDIRNNVLEKALYGLIESRKKGEHAIEMSNEDELEAFITILLHANMLDDSEIDMDRLVFRKDDLSKILNQLISLRG